MYEGQYFEIDLFPFWSDRALCEVELSHEHAPVNLPPALKVIREVTDDAAYSNAALAENQLL
jgi:CYTH domain-containing protein